jgi:hypothetical protein
MCCMNFLIVIDLFVSQMVGNYRVYKEQKDLYAMYCQEKPSSGRRQLCHMCISEQIYFRNKFLPSEVSVKCVLYWN